MFVKAAKLRAKLWTTYCSTAPLGWAKLPANNCQRTRVKHKNNPPALYSISQATSLARTNLARKEMMCYSGRNSPYAPRGGRVPLFAMEDYRIDISDRYGPGACSIQRYLPFTLIGATTRPSTAPLRARFGINMHLEYYDIDTLTGIVLRSARILGNYGTH